MTALSKPLGLLLCAIACLTFVSFPAANAEGPAAAETGFRVRMPIEPGDSTRVAFGLNPFGIHIADHGIDGHPGWDVEYKAGATVRAPADGTVQSVIPDVHTSGLVTLQLEHRIGGISYRTVFTNLASLATGVAVGAVVTSGQPIATPAARTRTIGTTAATYYMTHFQTDDFTKNEGLTNPWAVSPETVLTAEGRSTFSAEFIEPFPSNPRSATIPITRTWTLQGGGLPPRLDVRRNSADGFDYDYWFIDASGKTTETGTLTIEPRATLTTVDFRPSGGSTRLGVYDIVSGILRLRISDAGASRPTSLAGASYYTTSKPGGSAAPFGTVDTPAQNAAGVTGSLAVTGWALDDVGVSSVRILRDPVGAEPAGTKIPVGAAVIVTDARPDIAALYPTLPVKNRAGWGYLLLTNMLPNQGNGTYTLYIYADDADGQSTLLGTRTIACTNASATRPFGALDTPEQGATVSGTAFVNFGWVLTPLPKTIAPDGSTIVVYIDGVAAGTVSYNNYRADLAALFPGLANSNGAAGFRSLNTTTYANGVHTIMWVATDNAGAAEGIGSRYFTVQNGSGLVAGDVARKSAMIRPSDVFGWLPAAGRDRPVRARVGFNEGSAWQTLESDSDGVRRIVAPALSRVQISVEQLVDGYLRAGNERHPLPIGSTLDARRGLFSWQPGPGFLGTYVITLIMRDGNPFDLAVTLQPWNAAED
jgi:hypothetical protein